jgi:hypothetical protein
MLFCFLIIELNILTLNIELLSRNHFYLTETFFLTLFTKSILKLIILITNNFFLTKFIFIKLQLIK